MEFQSVISGEVSAAVTASVRACNAVRADAATKQALGNSRTSLMMADAIKSEGLALVDRMLSLYSEAEGLARRPKAELQGVVCQAIKDFHRLTAQMGLEPEAFGGSRSQTFTRGHDRVMSILQERADRYFAGYGAPKPEHWTVRRPVIWLIVQTAVATVVAGVVSAITANIVAG